VAKITDKERYFKKWYRAQIKAGRGPISPKISFDAGFNAAIKAERKPKEAGR
jgi:hypothetical protein